MFLRSATIVGIDTFPSVHEGIRKVNTPDYYSKNSPQHIRKSTMLWEISVFPREGDVDRAGRSVATEAAELGITDVRVTTAHGYLVQGNFNENQIQLLAKQLFADSIAERFVVAKVGDAQLLAPLTPHPSPPFTYCRSLV